MNLTAQQIARKIGISNATVSRVLNNSRNVNESTRLAVLEAVRECGGLPRLMGKRKKRKPVAPPRTGKVVEIIMVNRFPIPPLDANTATSEAWTETLPPEKYFSPSARLATSYGRHIIEGVVDELRRFGVRAMLQVTSNLTPPHLLQEVNSPSNSGVFVFGIPADDTESFLRGCRCPIVSFISHEKFAGWTDYVGIDNATGIRLAHEHLTRLGHRKIGYMAGELEFSMVFRERLAAYMMQTVKIGEPYRNDWVVQGSCDMIRMRESAEALLRQPDRPTAMMCCFDGAAVAVKLAADRVGLRIPQDLSVVGFDDEEVQELFTPPLTTMHVPTQVMGRQAAQIMMLRLERGPARPGDALSVRVTPKLVVRESTAAPKGKPPIHGRDLPLN